MNAPNPFATPQSPYASQKDHQNIDFGIGVSTGWELFTQNFGPLAVISLVFVVVNFGMGLLQQIPLVGLLVMLASTLMIQPVMTAGFSMAALKFHDGEEGDVNDLFAEFSRVGDLVLLALVVSGIYLAALIPGGVIMGIGAFPSISANMDGGNQDPTSTEVVLMAVGGLILFVTLIVVGVLLMWTYYAFVDRRQGFWDAIQTSVRITKASPLSSMGTMFVASMAGSLGILLCFVGVILTMPALYTITAATYRTAYPQTESSSAF